jgi:hypothetical protein
VSQGRPPLSQTKSLDTTQSRRERKKIEMRFAHMKRIRKLNRLRLRGLSGVRDEILLTATAQNLRRLTKLTCRARQRLSFAQPRQAWGSGVGGDAVHTRNSLKGRARQVDRQNSPANTSR